MIRKILVSFMLILLWTGFVTALVLTEAAFFTAPSVELGNASSIENRLSDEIEAAASSSRVGAVGLALINSGEIQMERGFGTANMQKNAGVDPQRSLFLVGSVSKAVSAWGVMKLVQDGRIGLDEPIFGHLKNAEFQGNDSIAQGVTVRRLLTHTSGLTDGPESGGLWSSGDVQNAEAASLSRIDPISGSRQSFRFTREPGAAFGYGNATFTLLQFLVEDVTERPFADYMKDTVLLPLGMEKSRFGIEAIAAEAREEELVNAYDRWLSVQQRRPLPYPAAIGLYTTAHDLAKFMQAFTRENAVLRTETLREMLSPQPATNGTWGLGQTLFFENGAGGYVVGHDGGAYPAWGAAVRVNLATGNGFVMTVSGGRGAVNQLSHDWAYWETGIVTPAARMQKAQNRFVPAVIAIAAGSLIILVWTLFRLKQKRTA